MQPQRSGSSVSSQFPELTVEIGGRDVAVFAEDAGRRARIETACRNAYCDESWDFIASVRELEVKKQKGQLDLAQEKIELAKIFATFIPDGAPAQINISMDDKARIVDNYKKGTLTLSVFYPAVAEVNTMLKSQNFFHGLKEAENAKIEWAKLRLTIGANLTKLERMQPGSDLQTGEPSPRSQLLSTSFYSNASNAPQNPIRMNDVKSCTDLIRFMQNELRVLESKVGRISLQEFREQYKNVFEQCLDKAGALMQATKNPEERMALANFRSALTQPQRNFSPGMIDAAVTKFEEMDKPQQQQQQQQQQPESNPQRPRFG